MRKNKLPGNDSKKEMGKRLFVASQQLGSVAQLPSPISQAVRLAASHTHFTTRTQFLSRTVMLS